MTALTIELKKRADGCPSLACVRADGTLCQITVCKFLKQIAGVGRTL